MFNISNYLNKFKKELQSTEENKSKIKQILEEKIGLITNTDDIEIKDFVLYIKLSQAYFNKLFIKKQEIITELSKNIPIKIVDIKKFN